MTQIEILLYSLPHYKKVIFAVYCYNDVKHLMSLQGRKCLELLEKWLEDSEGISMEKLAGTTGYANAAAMDAVTYYAAIDAFAYTVPAAAAACAAHAAAHAAYTAAAHVTAETYPIDAKMKESKLVQYKTYLLKMIDELTPLEKEFIKD